ncbi:MAG: hypothetical protein K2X66_10770 [Cyanobacteria bacterium]|nr:hypothetical protein [Cyanobacteriota bacterium]
MSFSIHSPSPYPSQVKFGKFTNHQTYDLQNLEFGPDRNYAWYAGAKKKKETGDMERAKSLLIGQLNSNHVTLGDLNRLNGEIQNDPTPLDPEIYRAYATAQLNIRPRQEKWDER